MTTRLEEHGSSDINTTDIAFLSVREVADLLGVSRSTVYRMDRKNGPLKIWKRGRRVLFDRCDFERYLASRTAAACSPAEEQNPDHSAAAQSDSHSPVATLLIPDPKEEGYRSGQRDLIMPNRMLPVVFYLA